MSGLWPDQPQIRNIPDRALALATQNPLFPDKDMAILKGKNPLFSGQTYGGASGGLARNYVFTLRRVLQERYIPTNYG
jgi:hypothetical protein